MFEKVHANGLIFLETYELLNFCNVLFGELMIKLISILELFIVQKISCTQNIDLSEEKFTYLMS